MTDEKRQEALVLGREIFRQEYVDSFLQQRQNS
jgi:hypothetical protein